MGIVAERENPLSFWGGKEEKNEGDGWVREKVEMCWLCKHFLEYMLCRAPVHDAA